jgi:hypothetical protein
MHEVSRPCVLVLDCNCLATPCKYALVRLWAYVLECNCGKFNLCQFLQSLLLLFLLDFFLLHHVFWCYCVIRRDGQGHLACIPDDADVWHDIVFTDELA